MERSRELYEAMLPEFPHQAQYAVSLAYRIRYVMQMNAREAMHLIELRSGPQGHPSYRRVAQEMHRQIADVAGHTAIADAMIYVDHGDIDLERLEAERAAERARTQR
jgi:thymidylate synthase ThyX